MNLNVGDKAIITLDNWFYAPDGMTYRAVFGTIKAIRSSEETLGVKTNAKSTNWYVEIGRMTVAGCQIHYAVRSDRCNLGQAMDWRDKDGTIIETMRPSAIFNADEVSA